MDAVLSLRVDSSVKDRLDALSVRTSRPVSVYVREALETYLEDLEDYYDAVAVRRRVRMGEEVFSLEQVKAALDLV